MADATTFSSGGATGSSRSIFSSSCANFFLRRISPETEERQRSEVGPKIQTAVLHMAAAIADDPRKKFDFSKIKDEIGCSQYDCKLKTFIEQNIKLKCRQWEGEISRARIQERNKKPITLESGFARNEHPITLIHSNAVSGDQGKLFLIEEISGPLCEKYQKELLDNNTPASELAKQSGKIGSGGFAKVTLGRIVPIDSAHTATWVACRKQIILDPNSEKSIGDVRSVEQASTVDQKLFENSAKSRNMASLARKAYLDTDGIRQQGAFIFKSYHTLGQMKRVDHQHYKTLEPAEKKAFMLALVDSLKVLHEAYMSHRDIKPDNIVLGPNNIPRLIDFGISEMSEQSETFRCGSRRFMAPEVAGYWDIGIFQNKPTDIYSLGVTMLKILGNEDLFYSEHETRSDTGWRKVKTKEKNKMILISLYNKRTAAYNNNGNTKPTTLEQLSISMLSEDPMNRPTIDQVFEIMNDLDQSTF